VNTDESKDLLEILKTANIFLLTTEKRKQSADDADFRRLFFLIIQNNEIYKNFLTLTLFHIFVILYFKIHLRTLFSVIFVSSVVNKKYNLLQI
jgi:hypothetical protein